jgi:hypothetical protein
MQNDIVKPPTKPDSLAEAAHDQPKNEGIHTQPQNSVDEAAKDNHEAPNPVAETVAAHQEEVKPAQSKNTQSKKPIMVIVMAVVVFVGLATGAVYTTMHKNSDKPVASSTSQTSPPTTAVADTSSDIDAALNDASQLPTSNEDPASDLSDQTLGL